MEQGTDFNGMYVVRIETPFHYKCHTTVKAPTL